MALRYALPPPLPDVLSVTVVRHQTLSVRQYRTARPLSLSSVATEVNESPGLKDDLWSRLQDARAAMLATLDGLSEYDRRRPMTPSGTNLLGLVKHLAGEEYGYLGETFGRPPTRRPTWFRDDPYTEIDMWATPDESSDYIIKVYREATAHADETIRRLDLDSPGRVPHWSDGQHTTLGSMLVLMVGETAQHAGHADIVRELIGAARSGEATSDDDRFTQVQAAADRVRQLDGD